MTTTGKIYIANPMTDSKTPALYIYFVANLTGTLGNKYSKAYSLAPEKKAPDKVNFV